MKYFTKYSKKIIWTLHSHHVTHKDLYNLNINDVFKLYKFWNNLINSVIPPILNKTLFNDTAIKSIITLSERERRFY